MSDTKSGVQLDPKSVSPVLKTKINIILEQTFPYTLNRADFTVNATNITNPTYFRKMNVIGVDESNKVLTVMFGGAWSGLYQMIIRHKRPRLDSRRQCDFNKPHVYTVSGNYLV